MVLNKNYFTVPDSEFPTVYALMTVGGGKVRSLREELAKELGLQPVGPQIQYQYVAEGNFGEHDSGHASDDIE